VEFTGKIYQVDPTGVRPAELTTMGSDGGGGRWEAFAYDIRDPQFPRFFATEDANKGTTRRFTPDKGLSYWKKDPWKMLHGNGTMDYLMITPYDNQTEQAGGTYNWTSDLEKARTNARSYYPQSEGIAVDGNFMYITTKGIKQLFIFDLDSNTYVNGTTVHGLFDGKPDQLTRTINSNTSSSLNLLYFCEEGGANAGVHARDGQGRFFTILESPTYKDETTGLSFSPDGKHMYVAYQVNGFLFDVWRDDGQPFDAKTLNVKYHQTPE
jgi:hypothetical protein